MRPNLAKLSVDDLEWESLGTHGLRRRLLSRDEETNAVTQYVDIPKAWKGGGVAHFHEFSEEVYVLHGDVSLNGRDYLEDGSYIYRPGGVVHGHDEGARQGCHCVIRTGGKMELNLIHEPTEEDEYVLHHVDDGRPLVLDLKTNDMLWAREHLGSGSIGWKVLSLNRQTGDHTVMLDLPAGWSGPLDLDPTLGWEWLVIRGGMELGDGSTFGTLDYSYRPAGSAPTSIAGSEGGAEVLLWRGV